MTDLRHTPGGVDRVLEAVRQFTAPRPTLLETLIRLGTPLMDAEAANKEVIRLTVENIKLQARFDELLALCGPEKP